MEINSKQLMIVAAIGAAAYFLIKRAKPATTTGSTKPLDITGVLGSLGGLGSGSITTGSTKPLPLPTPAPAPAPAPAQVIAPAPAPAPAASLFSSGPSGPAYTGGTMSYDDVLLAASGIKPAATKTEPLSGAAKHIVFAIGGT